jgi:hypothetical protein
VLAGVVDEAARLVQHHVVGAGLDEQRRQPGQIGFEHVQQRIGLWMIADVERQPACDRRAARRIHDVHRRAQQHRSPRLRQAFLLELEQQ